MGARWWWVVAVAAAGASAVAADRAVKRIFGHPPRRHASIDPGAVPLDAIDVQLRAVDGATLRGWLREPPSAQPGAAALVIHGWGGSAIDMLPVSDALLALGLPVLLLDARGHGRSDDAAVVSMPAFAEDVRAALSWMRAQPHVDPARILLAGHSVGAGACLFVAAGDPDVAAVVSLASMADPSMFMAQRLNRWLPGPLTGLALRYVEHAIGHRFTEFAPVYTIGQIKAPVLLLHGRRDTTVPVADADRLHALAPANSTLIVLPDGDHFSIEALQAAGQDLAVFLHEAGLIDARPGG